MNIEELVTQAAMSPLRERLGMTPDEFMHLPIVIFHPSTGDCFPIRATLDISDAGAVIYLEIE